MWQKIKIVIQSLFQPRLIIFCLAAYNFTSLWLSAQSTLIGVVPSWYVPWRYDNEPTLILLASVFLVLNKRWGDLVTAILSGYIIIHGLYIITFQWGWSNWLDTWIHFQVVLLEPDWLPVFWNTQIVFALIVFLLSGFHLIQRKSNNSFH